VLETTSYLPLEQRGEAASISIDARVEALNRLVENGIPAKSLIPGTGASGYQDMLRLTEHACSKDVAALLILPAYYYAGPTEGDLANYYQRPLEIASDGGIPVILYNIPQFTKIEITPSLITRLLNNHHDAQLGVKDSSGDLSQTESYLTLSDHISVFPGSEALLEKFISKGAAGCISGSTNITSLIARTLYDELLAGSQDVASASKIVSQQRSLIQTAGLMPAVKALLAEEYVDANWGRFIPPLMPFSDETRIVF